MYVYTETLKLVGKAHNECANFDLYKIEKTHKMGKLYKALLHKWKGKKDVGHCKNENELCDVNVICFSLTRLNMLKEREI